MLHVMWYSVEREFSGVDRFQGRLLLIHFWHHLLVDQLFLAIHRFGLLLEERHFLLDCGIYTVCKVIVRVISFQSTINMHYYHPDLLLILQSKVAPPCRDPFAECMIELDGIWPSCCSSSAPGTSKKVCWHEDCLHARISAREGGSYFFAVLRRTWPVFLLNVDS
jgi:hypothetical protein